MPRGVAAPVLLALGLALGLGACTRDDAGTPLAPTHAAQPVNPDGSPCAYPEDQTSSGGSDPTAPATNAAFDGAVAATLRTNRGDIGLTLDAASAPCAVNAVTSLASQGFYDETPCFLLLTEGALRALQCGDPTGAGDGGPGYRFADELSGDEAYPAGTVAMSNRGENTNGSQFFLVYEDSELPPVYTVVGTVSDDGLDVVREIAAAGTDGSDPAGGRPNEPLTIEFLEIRS